LVTVGNQVALGNIIALCYCIFWFPRGNVGAIWYLDEKPAWRRRRAR
jgi:hypothetical protein